MRASEGCHVIASPTKSAALLQTCSRAAPASAEGCAWCGKARPPRRRTWCSDGCSTRFWTNHWWSLARGAAKRRDKYRCVRCGHALPKRPARTAFVSEPKFKTAMRAWRKTRKAERLEVNHISPALGAHRSLSCVHHLDNLETLCGPCHAAFTRNSRGVGKCREATASASTPVSTRARLP